MNTNNNGYGVWITMLGGFLATIISLSIILSWKFDSSISAQTQTLRMDIEKKYVGKEVFDLHIGIIDEKLKSIMRAVGAREIRNLP